MNLFKINETDPTAVEELFFTQNILIGVQIIIFETLFA